MTALVGLLAACAGDQPIQQLVPRLAVGQETVGFDALPVGTTSTREVVVTNAGLADLDVAVTVTGAGFSLAGDGRFVLEPEAQRAIVLQFGPTERRPYEGTVLFVSNDPEPPTVRLTGSGS